MTPISRGFGGRRRNDIDPSRIPPGPDTPDAYSTGSWHPYPGHEDAFLDAWQDFANWSCQMPRANLAVLARDLRDPRRFVSLIAWDNLEDIRAWKRSPKFKAHLERVQDHIETFAPTALDVVVYGSACPACTQAKGVRDHYGVPYRSELVSELPRRHGHHPCPRSRSTTSCWEASTSSSSSPAQAACNASPKSRANGGYASDAAWAAATTSKTRRTRTGATPEPRAQPSRS